MLKQAKYKNISRYPAGPEYDEVVYVIIGDCCYFSGTEWVYNASTINHAEYVIKAITEQEHIPVNKLRFFDLQTHKGYRRHYPGEYELDEIILKDNSGPLGFAVFKWKPTKCPENIAKTFKKYIGIDLRKQMRELRSYYGQRTPDGLISAIDNRIQKCFHIREDGTPAYEERYTDVHEFADGLAWVCNEDDRWAQINTDGVLVTKWYDEHEMQKISKKGDVL